MIKKLGVGFLFLLFLASCTTYSHQSGNNSNLDSETSNSFQSSINYIPKPGTMIFFPSYLPHSYVVDHGKEPFRFIHWNIQAIPKGALDHATSK